MELFPSYGGAEFAKNSKKVIRLILKGCTNRPFYHISVQEGPKRLSEPVIEQIGNYDPLPNSFNEKLVSINYQRLEYWIRQGAVPTTSVLKLLGLSGYFAVHPDSLKDAFLRRKVVSQELEKLRNLAAKYKPQTDKQSSEAIGSFSCSDFTDNETVTSSSDESSNPPEPKVQ